MITDRDKELIKAMAFIKEYCKNIDTVDGCVNCPMYENCDNSKRQFPYYWYIPEV